jgi:hypothetical protein
MTGMIDVWQIVITTIIGGSGVVGIALYFVRRWLERKLTTNEQVKEIRAANRLRRARLEDELHHAQNRMLFWLHRTIVTEERNGDLEASFAALTAVEEKIKEHDREIIASNS